MIDDRLAHAANRLLAVETVSAAGVQFARGAWAVASRLPPAMRRAALEAAVEDLATKEPSLAAHVLAALTRAETDAEIVAQSAPDVGWPGGRSAPRRR